MVSVLKKISLFRKKNSKGNNTIDNVILNSVFTACETYLTKPSSKRCRKANIREGPGQDEVSWGGCAPYSPWRFLALQQEGGCIKACKMFFCPCSYAPMACPTYDAHFSPAQYFV